MISPTIAKLLLAATIAVAGARPAHVESLQPTEPAGPRIREAFATPYAQTYLRTFAASVRKNGDVACLQEKALDDAALTARGSALLQRYAVQMAELAHEAVDRAACDKALAASAGPRAAAELARFERDASVKQLKALNRPAELALTVRAVVEQFDHYLSIGRIKLDPISPAARGEEEPKEDPTPAARAAVQAFVDAHPSKAVDRYLELVDASIDARNKSINPQTALKTGPMTYFAGADRDLAELCIGRR